MKIAITGKGGVGKTTLAAVLAHLFQRDGYQVLAVDADLDSNLPSALGLPEEQSARIVPLSEQHDLITERTGASPGQFGQLFKINPTVSDIPDKHCVNFEGIKLLVLGAVRKGGSGCACPENVLLRNLLSHIILTRKEVAIVDMEAGIEHLGRATARSIDKMIIVVEPGARSIKTAKTIMCLAKDIGIGSFGVVGNKIRNDQQEEWLSKQFPHELILGRVSYDQIFLEVDIKGQSLFESLDGHLELEFQTIYRGLNKSDSH